jgi:hypothetical protein
MNFRRLHKEMVSKLLEGEGTASHSLRRSAFDHAGMAEPLNALIDKVANYSYKISDEDLEAVKKSGFSEDQIFELIVCAAVGQATRQYDRALTVLDGLVDDKGGVEVASKNTQ